MLHAARWKCRTQKSRHLRTIVQLCRAISSQLRHVLTIEKKLVKQQYPSKSLLNMVNFGLLAAEIDAVVWGTPANFIGFRVLFLSYFAKPGQNVYRRNATAIFDDWKAETPVSVGVVSLYTDAGGRNAGLHGPQQGSRGGKSRSTTAERPARRYRRCGQVQQPRTTLRHAHQQR